MGKIGLLWALLAGWGVSAQESAVREFRVLGYGDGFFEGVLWDRAEGEEVAALELSFLPDQKSRRYRLAGAERELSFYRLVEGAKGKVAKQEVGTARWPAEAERLLLVFFETADFAETGRYEILVLDESPSVWSAGGFRFLNLTGAELGCRMGERVFELPLDASEIVRFDPETTGAMQLQLSVPWEGKRRIVYSTRTAPDKNHAKLLVIKPPLEEGSLRVRVANLW